MFDLDAFVARVRAREDDPRRPRKEKAGQVPLFDRATLLPRPSVRYETQDGLVVDDENSVARAICLHSIEKATDARGYASIVGTAMKGKWELWWIELFAGPGRLYVRETGAYLPGSPLEALSIRNRFHGYVFSDLSNPCVYALDRRIGRAPNVHLLRGDANDQAELLDQIAALVPRHALVVLYGDPAGLHLKFKTLEFFIDRYPRLDLLLNLPTSGLLRAVAGGYNAPAAAVIDHPDPAQLVGYGDGKGDRVRDWYHRRLAAAGFDQIHSKTIYKFGTRIELYDLMLASRHPLAAEFFAEVTSRYQAPTLEDLIRHQAS
jgi:three-Cys-motif partner protein